MKEWKKPELEILELKNTEYYALHGARKDGMYTSLDGKFNTPTYSGKMDATDPAWPWNK